MFSGNEKEAFMLGYRLTENGDGVISPSGKPLAVFSAKGGYLIVWFGPKIARKNIRLHRFQAWLKYGDAIYQEGIVCRHLDGNPKNNAPDNIALGSASENMMDIAADVRHRTAFNASRHVLKHDHVAIVEYYKINGFKATLAQFAISSKGTLSFIINKTQTATPVLAHERPKRKKSVSQSLVLEHLKKGKEA